MPRKKINEGDKFKYLYTFQERNINTCVLVCTHVKLLLQIELGYPEINKSLQGFVLLVFLLSSKQSNSLRTCHFIIVEFTILLSTFI